MEPLTIKEVMASVEFYHRLTIKAIANGEVQIAENLARACARCGKLALTYCDCTVITVNGESIHELTCSLFDGKPLCKTRFKP